MMDKFLNNKGASMILALGLSVVIFLMIMGLSRIVSSSFASTTEIIGSHYAYFAAEAGMERALFDVSEIEPGSKTTEPTSTFGDNNSSYEYTIDSVFMDKYDGTSDSNSNIIKKIKPNNPFSFSLYCKNCDDKYIDDFNFTCSTPDDTDVFKNNVKYFHWQFFAKDCENMDYSLSGEYTGDDSSNSFSVVYNTSGRDIFRNLTNKKVSDFIISGNPAQNLPFFGTLPCNTSPSKKISFFGELTNTEGLSEPFVTCTLSVTGENIANTETKIKSEGSLGKFSEGIETSIPYLSGLGQMYSVSLGETF